MTAECIVVAAVAFVRDGQVLTVRKRGTTRFMLVGGKPEPGESAYDAAVRETREEVGLDVGGPGALSPLGVYLAPAANEPGRELHSTVFTASLPGEPRAAAEIAELRWMSLDGEGHDDLAPMLEHHVLPALRALEASATAVRTHPSS
ncbi:8-oxo-dGTP pyrophosphatase MutT (NUDIX family) [Nocardioides marinisabuli]|uniref:8-oxo-dGTP pyrophosphatase MutT (NUDIX family) n=1 Tax=Nocardioides marinisabuli TaxID=419476 RepID=A0A7Y9JSM2_9ACTN|nr:NUDIX domain-containing protein [Nocardioides marinisabuli]NYD58718.1 8-oxo-dGTP pyrophosphatase MutT (NUDIX family) [Nocardioides marinisabuli]